MTINIRNDYELSQMNAIINLTCLISSISVLIVGSFNPYHIPEVVSSPVDDYINTRYKL